MRAPLAQTSIKITAQGDWANTVVLSVYVCMDNSKEIALICI